MGVTTGMNPQQATSVVGKTSALLPFLLSLLGGRGKVGWCGCAVLSRVNVCVLLVWLLCFVCFLFKESAPEQACVRHAKAYCT